MPLYNCQVLSQLGEKKKIVREASDLISLKANLKRDNLILVKAKIKKEKEPNTFFAVSSKVKLNEIVFFLRQIAVMIKAGTSISDSLNVLRNQKFTKAFQKVLLEVYLDVQSGVLLSDAFAKHHKVFPDFFVNMIAIGETSDSLDTVLERLANYYEKDRKVKRKAKSAMVYPSILFTLIVIVFFFLTLFVLPQFEDTIKELGGDVPKITLIVMSISKFVKNNILYILLGVVGFILILFLFKRTNKGKYFFDYVKFHFPFLGNIEKNLITSRFSTAFIILLNSGMVITDILENLQKMLCNKLFDSKFKYSIEEVKRGKRIATAIENTKLFPPMLVQMINVGEKSGNLEEVLESTSSYFDEQVEASIVRATTALEPIMIILLGVVVAIVVLAVLLPIIALMQSI